MKYTLQVNTGSFTHTGADAAAIASRLDRCFEMLDVDRVIFGWSPKREINEAVAAYLKQHGVEAFFWLPVFGEIHHPETADAFVDVSGGGQQKIDALCEGEQFDFVCQSSERNLAHAIEVFHQLTDGLPVDGVFIDRIRYASAANSLLDLYGCWCPRCTQRFQAAHIDAEKIRRLSQSGSILPFLPAAVQGSVYRYEDPDIDALMRVKREIITQAVSVLCSHFRKAGKKIGIDTFAGGVADFVGQDLHTLGGMVDFIKPMVYLRTHAPAGVPFEAGALGDEIMQRISLLDGEEACSMEAAVKQIHSLMRTGAVVAPGIDANRIDPICSASPDYVCEYLNRLEAIGCSSAVLAWDAMRISDETLEAIAARKRS